MGSPHLFARGIAGDCILPLRRHSRLPQRAENNSPRPDTYLRGRLNLNKHLAVCSVQTVDGTILATSFIGNGTAVSGCRKQLLGRIARNRSQTGMIAENEQDNADLWAKIRHVDEQIAHLVSARIVQFAIEHKASILVVEHLGNLQPEKGTYSRRSNTKRAYWMKGRISATPSTKPGMQAASSPAVSIRAIRAENAIAVTLLSFAIIRDTLWKATPPAALCLCPQCQMRDHADRNASIRVGQRLIEHTQEPQKEKPPTAVRRASRVSKKDGVGIFPGCQTPDGSVYPCGQARRSDQRAWHRPGGKRRMGAPLPDIAFPTTGSL